jgi:cell division protein YceG involved in septum cleavage
MRHLLTIAVLVICGASCAGAYFALFPFRDDAAAPKSIPLESDDPEQVADTLYAEGYFKNAFSYHAFRLLSSLRPATEDGAVIVGGNQGALALLAQYVEPPIKKVTVPAGLRAVEVASVIKDRVGWSDAEAAEFAGPQAICMAEPIEGRLFPSSYAIAKDAEPAEVRALMVDAFQDAYSDIASTTTATSSVINDDSILIIASLIQREAAGKHDMRLISGVIWNRIFNDMTLDIDATLQYAKASEDGETPKRGWWPLVRSEDKYIDSPYNTYANKGLPPTPIANPGADAIAAALDPEDTKCLFYLHDSKRRIHCSPTYKGHVANVNYYLK